MSIRLFNNMFEKQSSEIISGKENILDIIFLFLQLFYFLIIFLLFFYSHPNFSPFAFLHPSHLPTSAVNSHTVGHVRGHSYMFFDQSLPLLSTTISLPPPLRSLSVCSMFPCFRILWITYRTCILHHNSKLLQLSLSSSRNSVFPKN